MNDMKRNFITLVLALLGASTLISAQNIPQFRDNERVVMMGNSITHGGHYHSYIWLYYMTRFPEMKIDIINAGMGGECAWDMVERIDADIFDRNPSYVTLTFGMNDTGYFDVTPDTKERSEKMINRSLDSFKTIEKKLSDQNQFKTVMIGGSPYDETSRKGRGFLGKNDAMRRIISEQKAAALRHGWGFVDFHEPMIDISLREQQTDSTFTFCRLDRIHPDCDGQMVMAYLFLKAQGLSGVKVADVNIKAGKGMKATTAENCTISGLQSHSNGVSFDYLARSLPYPVDSISQNGWANKRSALDAMKLVPFMEEFNQELLTVASLDEGEYELRIDGEHIADLSDQELAKGVNLAAYTNSPQYRQASALMYLNEERLQIEKRLVEYLWVEYEYLRKEGKMFNDDEDALNYLREICQKDIFLNMSYQWYKQAMNPEIRAIWTEYMHHLTDKIYEMNRPVTHRMEILKK